jgi:putative CocE/NonD family hydrolase
MKRIVVAILVAAAIAGCVSAPKAPVPGAPVTSVASKSLPSYFHDLSQKIPGGTLASSTEYHYRIPTKDGVRLDSWIVVPSGAGARVPLVIEITPYYGGGSIKACRDPAPGVTSDVSCLVNEINNLLTRGYALGFVSVRGTGASEGCFTQGGPSEGKDSAEAVEFLAAQSWSDGHVAVIGISYVGTTANDVWVEAPPHLTTVVTFAGITDLYKYSYVNGVETNGIFNFYYWPTVGLAPAGIEGGTNTDPIDAARSYAGEACPDQVDVQRSGAESAVSGDHGAYWDARNFTAEFQATKEKRRPPILYEMGLQDWNVKPHNIEPFYHDAVLASGAPVVTMMGNWTHLWPLRADWSHEILVAWLDHWMRGVDTGIMDAPPVWLQDETGVWRAESAWPAQDTQLRRLYLAGDEKLTWTPPSAPGDTTYKQQMGTPSEARPGKTSNENYRILRSEPLDGTLHLTHMPALHVAATSAGPKATLSLTLAEELPNGAIRPINWAIQSLNHLNSPHQGLADISGKRIQGDVPFCAQENVVKAGSRLLVYLSGEPVDNRASVRHRPASTTVTIHGGTSWIDLRIDPSIVPEDPQPKMLKTPQT